MEKLKFSTNLKCSGCIDKISKVLENQPNIKEWKVDLETSDKELSVETSLSEKEIQDLIASAGFTSKVK